jgi:hypothetical protein
MPLRIGLITDIHHGPDTDVRIGSAAPELLEKFTRRMRNDFHADLIVDMGDRINDTDLDADRRRLGDVRRMLEAAGVPILYAWGNHDLLNVSPPEARAILGKKADYESHEIGDYHIVILNSQDPTIERIGGTLSDPRSCSVITRSMSKTRRGIGTSRIITTTRGRIIASGRGGSSRAAGG